VRPRLYLLEQACVLDGDHGLVGEGLEELDLSTRGEHYLTNEERALLLRNVIEMAAERLSDLVGDLAENLVDKYL